MTTHVARPVLALPAVPHKKRLGHRGGRQWLRDELPPCGLAFARAVLLEAAATATIPPPNEALPSWAQQQHPWAVAHCQAAAPCTTSSDPAVLALIPAHVRADVFAAYCAWLSDASSAGGKQFAELLQVCPELDVAIYRHAQGAAPQWAGGSFRQWYEVAQRAARDPATGEKLLQVLLAAVPCPARRRLHF